MTQRSPRGVDRALFLIAAREPVPGKTKTRLGAAIGMVCAAALYAAFLVDLADRFMPAPGERRAFDVGWAYTPADVDFARVLTKIGCPSPPSSVCFVPQEGEGWDIRQANILRWAHEQGYERTVLIGSDSPQLPFAIAETSLALLVTNDVVLGRTFDGGYYLIGVRGDHDVLTGVPMSTASAADALAAGAIARGLSLAEVPATFDIDEEADLDRLRAVLTPDGAAAPVTWAALHRLGLAVPVAGGAAVV